MRAERLLYLGDEYYASLATVRALRAAGYEPWLLAVRGLPTYAERSRATAGTIRVPPPGAGADAFVAAVAAAAAEVRAAAVMPGTEAALNALAGRDADFGGAALGAPPPETLARATDKARLAELAAGAGLRTPPTVDAPAAREFPAVVKPARSTVRAGAATLDLPPARTVGDAAELAAFLAEAPDAHFIAQPFLRGSLRAVAGVAWQGRVVCSAHQRALRIHPPDCGASAYAETVEPEPALDERVAALVAAIGWSGIFELQFLESGGEPFLIDFNPRVYGSIALAIGAGLNLPAIWAELLLGRAPRPGRARVGVRYRAEERDVKALAAAVAQGRLADAAAILRPRRRTVHAVLSLRDPAPLAHLARRVASRLRR